MTRQRDSRPRLGGFEVLEYLGRGGMGTVYRAKQLAMDRYVALKVLRLDEAEPRVAERFRREARLLARMNHPHVVSGFAAGEERGMLFLAMELVEGESLGELIERQGRLAEGEALRIVREVALALEYTASLEIAHRDVKPDNILLTRSGSVKLCDLGLAGAGDVQRGARLRQPLAAR